MMSDHEKAFLMASIDARRRVMETIAKFDLSAFSPGERAAICVDALTNACAVIACNLSSSLVTSQALHKHLNTVIKQAMQEQLRSKPEDN